MTQHYPGPYEVELFYTEASLTHKMRLNTNIVVEAAMGDPFSSFTAATRGGGSVALNTAVTAFVTLMQPFFATTTNFTIANLYKYTVDSFDKTFLSTFDVNLLGTAGTAQLTRQSVYTFTTNLGGNIRIQLMEGNNTSNARIPIRDGATAQITFANFLVGSTNWIMARDGGYPTGKLNISGSVNDALEQQRYR